HGDLVARLDAHEGVVIANHNSPRQSVVSGPTAAVRRLVDELTEAGIGAKVIPVACAFHSPMVAAAADDLETALAGIALQPPELPVYSNTTAAPYPTDAAAVRTLLAGQLAAGVRFVDQIEAMYAAGARVFVEAGP